MFGMAMILGALVFAVSAGLAAPVEWPCFQGSVEHRGLAPDLPPPLELVWQADLKTANFSSPVISGGKVLVAGENGTVRALDLLTGREAWKVALKCRIYGSTPAVADGTAYYGAVAGNGSRTGSVFAISVADGSLRWTFTPPGDVYSSPLVMENLVVIGCDDGNVYGLQRDNGRPSWKFRTGNKVHDNSAALAGGTLFIGSFDGCMYALKAATGEQLWKFKTRKRVNTCPVVAGGQVFFGAEDGNLYVLSAADGTLAWSYRTRKPVVGAPAVADDAVYVGSTDGTLTALGRDGTRKWRFQVGSNVVASPLVAGRHIYTAAIDTLAILDQDLYSLAADTGKPEWKFRLKGPLFSSMAFSGGVMVVSGKAGRLYGFRSRSGPG